MAIYTTCFFFLLQSKQWSSVCKTYFSCWVSFISLFPLSSNDIWCFLHRNPITRADVAIPAWPHSCFEALCSLYNQTWWINVCEQTGCPCQFGILLELSLSTCTCNYSILFKAVFVVNDIPLQLFCSVKNELHIGWSLIWTLR